MKKIVWLILIVGLAIGGWLGWDYLHSMVTITLSPSSGNSITIGTSQDSENGLVFNKKLLSTTSKASLKLRKGTYLIDFSSTADYTPNITSINFTKNTVLFSPSLNYTSQKLNSLLQQDIPIIHADLAYDANMSNYTPEDEKLYQDGTWYSAKLVPNDPSQVTLFVVMHYKNMTWQLEAGPSFNLYTGVYPNVPASVIQGADNS